MGQALGNVAMDQSVTTRKPRFEDDHTSRYKSRVEQVREAQMKKYKQFQAQMRELQKLREQKRQKEIKRQSKNSHLVIKERVILIKTIEPENKLLTTGYVRIEALNAYNLVVPLSIIEYIMLYRWFLTPLERTELREQLMLQIGREAAERRSKRERREAIKMSKNRAKILKSIQALKK